MENMPTTDLEVKSTGINPLKPEDLIEGSVLLWQAERFGVQFYDSREEAQAILESIGPRQPGESVADYWSKIAEFQSSTAQTNPNQHGEKEFSFKSLLALRKKLLDLSGRNTLLNYKHPKASCIRLIDELPDQIISVLRKGKNLTFIPVPEPSEKELLDAGYFEVSPLTGQKVIKEYPSADQWAKYLGFQISYDLPDKRTSELDQDHHQDNNLQTLLYAPDLEARLRSLRRKSETAIEESGANILYLNVGFLEWYESRESDVLRRALRIPRQSCHPFHVKAAT